MSRFAAGGLVVLSLLIAEAPTLAGPHDEHADAGLTVVRASWVDDLISKMESDDLDAGVSPLLPSDSGPEETEIEFQDDVDTHSVMALRGELEAASTLRIHITINTAGGDTDEMLLAARAIERVQWTVRRHPPGSLSYSPVPGVR